MIQLLYGSTLDFAGIPDDFHLLYSSVTAIVATLAIPMVWRLRRTGIYVGAVIAMIVGSVALTVIRQTLIAEYIGQPQEQVHEAARKNLVVPIPFPGLRSANFAPYAPSGPLFARTPGTTLRKLALAPENILATWLTVSWHLLALAVFVLGVALMTVVTLARLVQWLQARGAATNDG